MKKILLLLLLSISGFAQNSVTEVLRYDSCNNPDSTDGGVVIKTNLPFGSERYMPTIIIEGYNYGLAKSVGLILNYYVFNSGSGDYFVTKNMSSHGGYTPETYLFNDNGKVSIFMQKTGSQYCLSFRVRAWVRNSTDGGAVPSWFTGWTAAVLEDGPPTYTNNFVKLEYQNGTEKMILKEIHSPAGKYISFGQANNEFFAGLNAGGNIGHTGGYNIGIGTNSSFSVTTGSHNVGLGNGALYYTTTGDSNVGIGNSALILNSTGRSNIALGGAAMYKNTTGSYNTALNYATLFNNTTGTYNVALGYSALNGNETGHHNIALGANAFRSNKAGSSNIFIGNGSAYHAQGNNNVGVGQSVLSGYTKTSSNIVIGYSAASKSGIVDSLSLVSNSIVLGYNAGYNNSLIMRPLENTILIGYNTGRSGSSYAKSVKNSIGMGFQALYGSQFDFTNSIALGYESGKNIAANLSNVILIGQDAGNGLTASNVVALGGTGSYQQDVLINSVIDKGAFPLQVTGNSLFDGNVIIGTTDIQGHKLAVDGSILAEKVKIKNSMYWPDYVFEKEYPLPNLVEVESFISENKHLPEIPSANEIAKNGQDLGEMNRLLLQKVEELTLYLIQEHKQLEVHKRELEVLKKEMEELKFSRDK